MTWDHRHKPKNSFPGKIEQSSIKSRKARNSKFFAPQYVHNLSFRTPAGPEEELRPRRGAAGGAGVAADVLRDAGRGDQDDEPARQRHRARRHPQDPAHPRLHHLRARRAGEGGVLQVSHSLDRACHTEPDAAKTREGFTSPS